MKFLHENQSITIPQLISLFNQGLEFPPKEVVYGIMGYDVMHKRKDGLIVRYGFTDHERYMKILISNEHANLSEVIYGECHVINVLNWRPTVIACESVDFYTGSGFQTILSLEDSPVMEFSSVPIRERKLRVVPTDLMILFDDFDEKIDAESGETFWRYNAKRREVEVELMIYPLNGRVSLTMKSNQTIVQSLDMENCEEIRVDLKYHHAIFTFGYDELYSYIVCCLLIKESCCRFSIDPNVGPYHSTSLAYET